MPIKRWKLLNPSKEYKQVFVFEKMLDCTLQIIFTNGTVTTDSYKTARAAKIAYGRHYHNTKVYGKTQWKEEYI